MKRLPKKKRSRVLAGALVFALLVGVFFAPSLHANKADCERGLRRCAVDAVVAGMTGGPLAFAMWSSGCLMGYDFCLRYVD